MKAVSLVSTLLLFVESQTVSTFTSGQFQGSHHIQVDSAGDFYVPDWWDHTIWRITRGGAVSRFAGGNGAGLQNGPRLNARFNQPLSSVFGNDGSMYVVDTNNNAIRKIDIDGTVSTFAGGNGVGLVNGPGNAAQFNSPQGITIDPSGNLYVADWFNYAIRRITPEGIVSTYAGGNGEGRVDGNANSARFRHPLGVVYFSDGSIFVSDGTSIRRISRQGNVSTIAGGDTYGFADGNGEEAQFNVPYMLDIDSNGNLYVPEFSNHRIRLVRQNGTVTTIAGGSAGFTNGAASVATFNNPSGILVISDAILIGDSGNRAIRRIDIPGLRPQDSLMSPLQNSALRALDWFPTFNGFRWDDSRSNTGQLRRFYRLPQFTNMSVVDSGRYIFSFSGMH